MKRSILIILWLVACALPESFAQHIQAQESAHTVKRYEMNGNVMHAQLPDLKAVWKKHFKHFVSVPENGGYKAYKTLKRLFSGKEAVYNPKNTLLICPADNVAYVKEVLGPVTIYVTDFKGFYSPEGALWTGTVSKDPETAKKDAFVFLLEPK